MPQSVDREVRGLQRASKRLEIATKEWEEAYRRYALALTELKQKTAPAEIASGAPRSSHRPRAD